MSAWVEAAAHVGRRICETAVWHDGRCNWVGALPDEDAYGRTIINYAALGPDLYGGTSGVALFLAQLHAVTGEEGARRTALGALRHAYAHAGDSDQPAGPGLYAGRVGIALASVRAGLALGEDEAVARGADLLGDLEPAAEFDLMTGNAGTILGLLALGRLLARDDLSLRAHDFGRRLLADVLGRRRGRVVAIACPKPPSQPHRAVARHGGRRGRLARSCGGRAASAPTAAARRRRSPTSAPCTTSRRATGPTCEPATTRPRSRRSGATALRASRLRACARTSCSAMSRRSPRRTPRWRRRAVR